MKENIVEDDHLDSERFSIQHLFGWTTAIAISLALVQLIRRLRFPADSWYHGIPEISIGLGDWVLAIMYGTGLALSVFAFRTRSIWDSPGKIIALIFGTACVIHLGLDLSAAGLLAYRFKYSIEEANAYVPLIADARGLIFQTWYENIAVYYGYILLLPFLAYVVFRTWSQRSIWKIVWVSILIFIVASIGRLYFNSHHWFPSTIAKHYFTISISIPILAIMFSFGWDLVFHRGRLDWWTILSASVFSIGSFVIGFLSLGW